MRIYLSPEVCGLTYKVFLATGLEVSELVQNEGWTDCENCRIYLRASLAKTPSRLFDTLVHELTHALFEACGISHLLAVQCPKDADDVEELIIRMMTPALITTFRSAGLLKGKR